MNWSKYMWNDFPEKNIGIEIEFNMLEMGIWSFRIILGR